MICKPAESHRQIIDFLTPYYQIYHEVEFGIHEIMDSLKGLGKTE